MSRVERLSADAVAASPRRGFWIHAGDFNQKINQAKARETELQQRLTAADQLIKNLKAQVANLRQGPCKLITGDELP